MKEMEMVREREMEMTGGCMLLLLLVDDKLLDAMFGLNSVFGIILFSELFRNILLKCESYPP